MPHWTASLEVRPIRPEERDLWRRLMATHHYLGFRGLVGESLYYVACVENEWVALLGWAAAAWMCRPRDQSVDWVDARPAMDAPALCREQCSISDFTGGSGAEFSVESALSTPGA